LATREKQLHLWRELILRYHTAYKIKTLIVHDCPLWKNTNLGRELDSTDISIIMNDLIESGHGEWEDLTTSTSTSTSAVHTRCRILWRTPQQLASDIYEWAQVHGFGGGGVCTVYELHSGEDVHGMSFQGADEELLRRGLEVLEHQGKCTMFQGDTSSEDGIKFY